MGTVALLILMVALSPIPYSIARYNWLAHWQETTWGIGLIVLVVFAPWYAVFLVLDGGGGLVPLAMIALLGAFMLGLWSRWRGAPMTRRDERAPK